MSNNVLIIEKNAAHAEKISDLLAMQGYRTNIIIDGGPDEVMEAISADIADMVLLDLWWGDGLSCETALTLAERIRKLFPMPIVFLTHYITPEIRELADRVCPECYIFKPFTDSELIEILKNLRVKRAVAAAGGEGLKKDVLAIDSVDIFRAVFNKAGIGIALVSRDGRIIHANRAFELFLGYGAGELAGMSFTDFTHPGDAENDLLLADDLCRGVMDWYQIEKRYIKKDGSRVWGLMTASLVQNELNDPEYYIRMVEDIDEKKKALEYVTSTLREKESLLKEVHHRVKNNLQIMSSLIHLQSNDTDDERIKSLLLEFHDKILAMKLVHERLYREEDLAFIHLKEYIDTLSMDLLERYKHLNRGVRITSIMEQDILVEMETAIPLGLAVNEILSNALIHAFPGPAGGRISIRCRLNRSDMVLIIQDDGIGTDTGSIDGRGGLGLKLVSVLAQQLKGSMDMRRDSGTTVVITVPLDKGIRRAGGTLL